MTALTLGLAAAGLVLLFGAPVLARLLGRSDPVGLTRVFQAIAVTLLVGALLARPHNPDTAAFPPPPDAVEAERR